MLHRRAAVLVMIALGVSAPPVHADGGPTWNRKVEALSVLISDGGTVVIGGILSVEAEGASTLLDLRTEMLILLNGVPLATETFEINAQPAGPGGPCGPCDLLEMCVCGFDPVTGVFGCQCGSFLTWKFHTSTIPLQPEDEIMVLLRPARGALPEQDESDDQLVRPWQGHPIYWNRSIGDVRVRPAAGTASNLFCVTAELDLDASYDGRLSLGADVELLINGVPWSGSPACPGPCGETLTWNPCAPGGSCPGLCAMNDVGQFVGECSGACSPTMPPCNCCVSGWAIIEFPRVPAVPGDLMKIILRPVPGALPELPGFEEDDEMDRPVPCPGDVDGNGFVDVDDLVEVILDWDCTDPPGPCPGDVNFDGVVNVDDILMVILNWGPCFPV